MSSPETAVVVAGDELLRPTRVRHAGVAAGRPAAGHLRPRRHLLRGHQDLAGQPAAAPGQADGGGGGRGPRGADVADGGGAERARVAGGAVGGVEQDVAVQPAAPDRPGLAQRRLPPPFGRGF